MDNILDFKGVNALHFYKRFFNEETCYEYIAKANGEEMILYAKNADIINTGRLKGHTLGVVYHADMMKVQQQERLLIK